MSQKEDNIKDKGCCGRGCEECTRRDAAGGCDGCDKSCGGSGSCGNSDGCCAKASGGACASGCGGGCSIRGKLHSFNYFDDIPGGYADDDMVEVQFKNTRKGYYINSTNLPLEVGDMVAVEAAPGHDIGQVTLTGALVRLQMRKAGVKPDSEKHRVFRKAKPSDLERYEKARALENDTMIRARKIASSLQLNMKIGDVEYQGDGNKAIFYYIADERVDFRQLIKVLAETFKVRIEMKQIGARQEAGRIGGIGPCGRPLCCTTWMTNFVSVSTGAARFQDISMNPQKLAGQCAKLKCCLNFEVDSYVEASRKLPGKEIRLETADATYFYFKADIFKGEITYSTDKHIPSNLVTLSAERAWEVIAMNKRGDKPLALKEASDEEKPVSEYADILGQDSLTRFDNKKKKKRKKPDGGAGCNGGEGRRERSPKSGDKPAGKTVPPADAGERTPSGNGEANRGKRRDRSNDRRQDTRNGERHQDGKEASGKQPSGERRDRGARKGNGNGAKNRRTSSPQVPDGVRPTAPSGSDAARKLQEK